MREFRSHVTGLAITLLLLAAAQAHAGEVAIKNTHFKYGGISYFRCNAEEVRLGSYGEKKTPILKCNYLSVQNHLDAADLKRVGVAMSGPFSITWENYSKADVQGDADLKYFGIDGKAALSGSYAKFKSAEVKLVKFSITEGDMKKVFNEYAPNRRNYMRAEGSDARVVPQVWVAMSAELASQFSSSTSLSLAADGDKLNLTAEVGTGKSYTITIAPGTTFAYLLYKVKSWNSDKTKITDFEDDQWSTN
jgi:hypothetical protein